MNGVVKIHGKEYKTVALRVAEFRAAHPDYTISTELVEANDVLVIMKASILDNEGRLIGYWLFRRGTCRQQDQCHQCARERRDVRYRSLSCRLLALAVLSMRLPMR